MAKMMPIALDMTLEQGAGDQNPRVATAYERREEQVRCLIDIVA